MHLNGCLVVEHRELDREPVGGTVGSGTVQVPDEPVQADGHSRAQHLAGQVPTQQECPAPKIRCAEVGQGFPQGSAQVAKPYGAAPCLQTRQCLVQQARLLAALPKTFPGGCWERSDSGRWMELDEDAENLLQAATGLRETCRLLTPRLTLHFSRVEMHAAAIKGMILAVLGPRRVGPKQLMTMLAGRERSCHSWANEAELPLQEATKVPIRLQPCIGHPLQSLGAMTGEQNPNRCELCFVEVILNGRLVQALVDTGASHNFVRTGLATEVGLRVQPCEASVKAVNSKATAATGVASNVRMRIGQWEGHSNLTVVPLDDFDLILGQDFLRRARAVVMPYWEKLVILSGDEPVVVRTAARKKGGKLRLVSAMSMKRAARHSDTQTYVAALLGETTEGETGTPVPPELEDVLEQFVDRMSENMPKSLPPRRAVDHRIELEPGSRPVAKAPYRLSGPELGELKKQLTELLDAGLIRPSRSPYGAPVLFQKKKDTPELRMCLDYRALNKQTIKNRYPLPLAADCFDKLAKAKVFSKLDLRKGYYQVRIAEGDEPKTTCVTRYGSFEFMVMPFGLCNAPATFCTLMNDVLRPFLDKFVVVYLDDIVVYSETMEEHKRHLAEVFKALRENQLYLKRSKCVFGQTEIPFLGHWVGQGCIRMEEKKIEAITD